MARQVTPLNATDKVAFDRMYAGPLGTELTHKRHCVKGVYDFTVLTGAVATYNLLDPDGNTIVIPANSIITQVWTQEITNVTTSASGTLSFGVTSTTDLLGATAAATFSGIQAGTPTGSAATMVAVATDAYLTGSIATGALTAGKVYVFVEFVNIN